jgi:transposase InsO family protein
MKYAFVEYQRREHSVRTLCRALRVSPSGYYAARSRPPSARDERQSSLTTKIREVHLASRQTYGAPRVHAELSVQGIACCRNTVAKLMRRAQIVPKAIRHFRVTTDSRNTKEVLPNLLRHNAPMESFFHSLKTELVMHCDYKTRDQARASLFDYMEVFYNRQRRHSTINYVAPLAFEESTTA